MKEYDMISHTEGEKFCRLCDVMLKKGWTPLGGVAVAISDMNIFGGPGVLYTQAFVREMEGAAELVGD